MRDCIDYFAAEGRSCLTAGLGISLNFPGQAVGQSYQWAVQDQSFSGSQRCGSVVTQATEQDFRTIYDGTLGAISGLFTI